MWNSMLKFLQKKSFLIITFINIFLVHESYLEAICIKLHVCLIISISRPLWIRRTIIRIIIFNHIWPISTQFTSIFFIVCKYFREIIIMVFSLNLIMVNTQFLFWIEWSELFWRTIIKIITILGGLFDEWSSVKKPE